MQSSSSSSDEHIPKGQDWSDEIHINPDRPRSVQDSRYYNPGSSPVINRKEPTQFSTDYFAKLNHNPPTSREENSQGFVPLYSSNEKTTLSSGVRPRGMPTVTTEHGYPALSPAPDAPGDPPTRHDFEKMRSQSTKSVAQLRRSGTLSTARSTLGLIPEAPIVAGHDVHNHLTWSGIRYIMREPFAEFLGTFVMILFGDGSVAQVLLSGGEVGWGLGNYQSINWCWALGVMLGVYTAGDSGAFLNPAVMFSFCLFRGFPWKRFPIYFIAEVLGAFVGSGVVYANYINAINNYEGHGIRTVPSFDSKTPTAGIFATYPQPFLTKASQFFSEFIASTILVFVIFALKDESNPGAMGKSGAGKFFPLALLFLIFGIGAAFGFETGYAINLARDFGPRMMSYVVGYGTNVFKAGDYYFWIPMVAPFFGCAFGGFLYDVFIYTGPESPINTPFWGFRDLFKGGRFGGNGRAAVEAEVKEKIDGDMV